MGFALKTRAMQTRRAVRIYRRRAMSWNRQFGNEKMLFVLAAIVVALLVITYLVVRP